MLELFILYTNILSNNTHGLVGLNTVFNTIILIVILELLMTINVLGEKKNIQIIIFLFFLMVLIKFKIFLTEELTIN